ncbi:MAG TPA: hypothetical protein VHZ95_00195, partial [Polyangiales bacterium]|nr:hypothetical protein [Polyangiales bacterium]
VNLAREDAAISLPMSPHARAFVAKRDAHKKARARSLERGPVAYLRCDGLLRRKHQVCPHDRRLEAAVWSSLQALAECRAADPGVGQAELRLTIQRGSPIQIELGAVAGARSLNLRAVSRCTAPVMTKLRTRLRTQHGVVTFRFGVR